MKKPEKQSRIEIWTLDGFRCAVAVDGLVRYVGTPERCRQLAIALAPAPDRERQDKMLIRAVA